MNIYVGNLPREATEEDLRKAFEEFGQVASVKIITDRFTGDSRGFGFVEMPNSPEATVEAMTVEAEEVLAEVGPGVEDASDNGHSDIQNHNQILR